MDVDPTTPPTPESAPERPRYVTNNELALELRALRSDVKIWVLAGVALNQFLGAVEVPTPVTAAVVLGLLAKGGWALLLSRIGGS